MASIRGATAFRQGAQGHKPRTFVPHFVQNFAPGTSRAPQSVQNLGAARQSPARAAHAAASSAAVAGAKCFPRPNQAMLKRSLPAPVLTMVSMPPVSMV